jgi:hypothetical protein
MSTLECPRCGGRMEEGYLVDHTHGGYLRSTWVSGIPEKSMWTGLKLQGHEQIPVCTFRCRGCGFLESYALRPG